jgi:triose/dihydroxyacetone kinase / FAD-AMP lyase (cyclizing)
MIMSWISAAGRVHRCYCVQGVRVVCNTKHDLSKVAVISGGGSGHEPAMAGYVGPGMLAAAVAGDVFASPSTRAVYEAIMKVTGAAGCLVCVLNYTGDRLNFGMAIEIARADGLQVEMTAIAGELDHQLTPVHNNGTAPHEQQ